MLREPFRSDLKKLGWDKVVEQGANPPQSKRRIREESIISLADIVLIYEQMPKKERDELFYLFNFKKLFDTLYSNEDLENIKKLDIALYSMRKIVDLFQEKYLEINKDTNRFVSLANKSLEETFELCQEVTHLEKLKQSYYDIPGKRLQYFCNWEHLKNRDINKLREFIKNNLNLKPKNIILRDKSEKEIIGSFESQKEERYEVYLTLDIDKDSAYLTIKGHFIQLFLNLEYRKYNDELRLYFDKSKIRKQYDESLFGKRKTRDRNITSSI